MQFRSIASRALVHQTSPALTAHLETRTASRLGQTQAARLPFIDDRLWRVTARKPMPEIRHERCGRIPTDGIKIADGSANVLDDVRKAAKKYFADANRFKRFLCWRLFVFILLRLREAKIEIEDFFRMRVDALFDR
ncbi:hypothetical protein [Caballeronia sp. 15711]|uniref:hypothetical protein n=1 Tax=Caballeronia sp. 15711 TaxID=3391029 RepID=UPI0039E4E8EB